VNIWAFYRVRKLRKRLLYIVLPSAALTGIFVYYIVDLSIKEVTANPDAPPESLARIEESVGAFSILLSFASLGLLAYEIYLVMIWSQQHNQKYDQPSVQSTRPGPGS
jgi:hypothetical protein